MSGEKQLHYELTFNDGDVIKVGNLRKFFCFLYESNETIRKGCPSHYTAEEYSRLCIACWNSKNLYLRKKHNYTGDWLFEPDVIPGDKRYTVKIQRVMGRKKNHRLPTLARKSSGVNV